MPLIKKDLELQESGLVKNFIKRGYPVRVVEEAFKKAA